MNSFYLCFIRVFISLLFCLPGYFLAKSKKASGNHLGTLSSILIYACGPCMIINSFYLCAKEARANNLALGNIGLNMFYFGIFTFILQVLFMLILYLILKRKYDDPKYRVLTIGSVLGNVGFFGLPLVEALIPNNPLVLCYSSVYIVTMNILVFTVGVFCLTNDKSYISIRDAIINPTTLALFVAIPAFIFADKLNPNDFTNNIWDGIALLGKMTTPICMIIMGIRLANVNFLSLFKRPFIYIMCFLKLIVFPLFCFLLVYFLPFIDNIFKSSILILSATPCASVILNMAEIHHKEEELAANSVLVATLLSIISIPLIILALNLL